MTIVEIDGLTKKFSDAHAALSDRVSELNQEVEVVKRRHMSGIRGAVCLASGRKADLREALEASTATFVKPRTLVLHGIKVGFRKGKGGIDFDDADAVVSRIKKLFPNEKDTLIATKEKPNVVALGELPAVDLKRLGCTIESAGDVVVISPTDSDVDKIVTALLKDADPDAAAEE